MNVLLVTPYYYPKIGGLEIYARQLALALAERHDVRITVVTSNGSRKSVIEQVDGMTVYRLGTWFKVSNTPVNPLWAFKMRAIIKRIRPDVIHAHTPVPSMADAAALAAGKTPLVVTYHAATLQKAGSTLFNIVARMYGLYERFTLSRAKRIIAVSPFVKHELPANLQAKTDIVANAVWERSIISRIQPDTTNFLFVGSLDRTHAWKGLDLIMAAVAQVPSARLTVMGDGNGRSSYEVHARELGLDGRITFAGALNGQAKASAFAGAVALIAYPTTSNDAFPTVFPESWAAHVPVVAAAIGPIPDLIDDGVTGYLVPPHDASALAVKLTAVLADKPGRTRVAENASKLVATHYTWERQADVMQTILEAVR